MKMWESKEIGHSKIFLDQSHIVLIQNDGTQVTISNEEFQRIIEEFSNYHKK